MRKIRLYKYDHAPGHVHDTIPAYRNSVPFSEDGIAKWCELVEPKDAEFFYCGQYNDKTGWMLHPNRFDYFVGNEERHIFDLEGDHSEGLFLPWMRQSVITAMNAEPNHRNWNCFVRPGCSMLLMDMVKRPIRQMATPPPDENGFFFMGQRDPNHLREKVHEAFRMARVPGEWVWRDKWNAVSDLSDPQVQEYERGLRRWAFALCPAGTGQMTVRYFEARALNRAAVVIADNLLFGRYDDAPPLTMHMSAPVSQLANWFRYLYAVVQSQEWRQGPSVSEFFSNEVRPYFEDPTCFFLGWLAERGLWEV